MNKYDVIVVGAGNAGLAAAANTSLNGLKTLLIEKNPVPGGSATSFCRGRFEFEPSLHEACNVGTKEELGSLGKILNAIGADVDWHIEDTAFRVIADSKDGYDVTMPVGVENFCQALEKEVPGSYESAIAVFELVKKVNDALAYMGSGKVDPKVLATEHVDFLRMASSSVDECLDALNMPKKAQNIIKTYWSYLGARTDEMDFALYFVMVERYLRLHPAVPRLKSHGLSLATEKTIRDHGGDILYNTEVCEVLTDNGKAVGVRTKTDTYYGDYIILNCFPEVAYKNMLPAESVPDDAVKLANARKTGAMFFTVYLGLDCTKEELGFNDYTVFLYNTPDSIEQYESSNTDDPFMIANCLNVIVPESSPKGTSTVFLTQFIGDEIWGEVEPRDYKKKKNEIAKHMIEKCEKKLGISLKDHIEEIVIAAPPTFARYLGTPKGTPYGYEIQSWDSMITRIMSAKTEQIMPNLYFVGAHGERTDGYSSTYSNGFSVAGKIIKEASSHE